MACTCGGRDHEVSAVGGARDFARGGERGPAVRSEVEYGGASRIRERTAVGQPVRRGPGVARVTCMLGNHNIRRGVFRNGVIGLTNNTTPRTR